MGSVGNLEMGQYLSRNKWDAYHQIVILLKEKSYTSVQRKELTDLLAWVDKKLYIYKSKVCLNL